MAENTLKKQINNAISFGSVNSSEKMNEINDEITTMLQCLKMIDIKTDDIEYMDKMNNVFDIDTQLLQYKIPNGIEYLQNLRTFQTTDNKTIGDNIVKSIFTTLRDLVRIINNTCNNTLLYNNIESIINKHNDVLQIIKTNNINEAKKYLDFYNAVCNIFIYINNKLKGVENYSIHERFVSLLDILKIDLSKTTSDIESHISNIVNTKYQIDSNNNNINEILFIIYKYPQEIKWDDIKDSQIKNKILKLRNWLIRNKKPLVMLSRDFIKQKEQYPDITDLVQYCKGSDRTNVQDCNKVIAVSKEVGKFFGIEKKQLEYMNYILHNKNGTILEENREFIRQVFKVQRRCNEDCKKLLESFGSKGGYTKKRKNRNYKNYKKQRSRKLRR